MLPQLARPGKRACLQTSKRVGLVAQSLHRVRQRRDQLFPFLTTRSNDDARCSGDEYARTSQIEIYHGQSMRYGFQDGDTTESRRLGNRNTSWLS
jgi:hypothetical protein